MRSALKAASTGFALSIILLSFATAASAKARSNISRRLGRKHPGLIPPTLPEAPRERQQIRPMPYVGYQRRPGRAVPGQDQAGRFPGFSPLRAGLDE